MNRIALAALPFLAFGAPASALTAEDCAAFSDVAHTIMLRRQEGVRASTMVSALSGLDRDAAALIQALIDDAYAEPQWSSPDRQREAANEFSAAIYSLCRSEGA